MSGLNLETESLQSGSVGVAKSEGAVNLSQVELPSKLRNQFERASYGVRNFVAAVGVMLSSQALVSSSKGAEEASSEAALEEVVSSQETTSPVLDNLRVEVSDNPAGSNWRRADYVYTEEAQGDGYQVIAGVPSSMRRAFFKVVLPLEYLPQDCSGYQINEFSGPTTGAKREELLGILRAQGVLPVGVSESEWEVVSFRVLPQEKELPQFIDFVRIPAGEFMAGGNGVMIDVPAFDIARAEMSVGQAIEVINHCFEKGWLRFDNFNADIRSNLAFEDRRLPVDEPLVITTGWPSEGREGAPMLFYPKPDYSGVMANPDCLNLPACFPGLGVLAMVNMTAEYLGLELSLSFRTFEDPRIPNMVDVDLTPGKLRLGTGPELEKAIRGGLVGKYYALGDEYDPELYAITDFWDVTDGPQNGYGLYHATGNAIEVGCNFLLHDTSWRDISWPDHPDATGPEGWKGPDPIKHADLAIDGGVIGKGGTIAPEVGYRILWQDHPFSLGIHSDSYRYVDGGVRFVIGR